MTTLNRHVQGRDVLIELTVKKGCFPVYWAVIECPENYCNVVSVRHGSSESRAAREACTFLSWHLRNEH